MKRKWILFVSECFIIMLMLSCAKKDDFPVLKGPYLGQKPPGMTPELFAPDIVPTEANEALYGFFNDGTLFLFDRTPADLEEWTPAVYRMELKDGKWTQPNASPYQGKPWYHYYTTAPEGEQVYFAWKGSLGDRTSSADLNIWRVLKTDEGWTEPRKLPSPVNSMDLDTYPKVTEDGTLYFFSNREGGFGGHDIYRSPSINDKHTTIENLGAPINTEFDELDPFIASDESYLIYCSKALEGFGGFDLYVTFKKFDGTWTKPVNMGEGINTSAYDWVPHVTPDGKYFFFNSTRSGSWDIYWVDAKIIEDLKPDESGTFTDPRDGNVYKWVKIGNQIWMAENLRFITDSGSWCWENKEENCLSRGRLYNWAAAMQASPPGWHLPSDEEWKELERTLGLTQEQADQEGFRVDKDSLLAGKIKLIGAWPDKYEEKSIIITNETGFSAIITGLYSNEEFSHDGYTGWWTSDENDTHAWIRHIGFFDNTIGRIPNRKEFAFPVRCVKDQNEVKEFE